MSGVISRRGFRCSLGATLHQAIRGAAQRAIQSCVIAHYRSQMCRRSAASAIKRHATLPPHDWPNSGTRGAGLRSQSRTEAVAD